MVEHLLTWLKHGESRTDVTTETELHRGRCHKVAIAFIAARFPLIGCKALSSCKRRSSQTLTTSKFSNRCSRLSICVNDEYVVDDRDESGRATGKSSSELTSLICDETGIGRFRYEMSSSLSSWDRKSPWLGPSFSGAAGCRP